MCTTFSFMAMIIMFVLFSVITLILLNRRLCFQLYRHLLNFLNKFKQLKPKKDCSFDILHDGHESSAASKTLECLPQTLKVAAIDNYFHKRKKSTKIYFTFISKVNVRVFLKQSMYLHLYWVCIIMFVKSIHAAEKHSYYLYFLWLILIIFQGKLKNDS